MSFVRPAGQFTPPSPSPLPTPQSRTTPLLPQPRTKCSEAQIFFCWQRRKTLETLSAFPPNSLSTAGVSSCGSFWLFVNSCHPLPIATFLHVLGIEPRIPGILSKSSAPELYLQLCAHGQMDPEDTVLPQPPVFIQGLSLFC